jgi:DNA-binding CsgD family transcriptional regulator
MALGAFMKDNSDLASSCTYICSRNPVATWAVSNLLIQSSLTCRVPQFFARPLPIAQERVHITLFDVSSIPEWPALTPKWATAGYKQILLVAENWVFGSSQLRALHLGVAGIVDVGAGFRERLFDALTRVAGGQLFVRDVVVNRPHRWSELPSNCSPASRLSFREEQVLDLLMLGFSNRRIGIVLGISERTAKFHVGNILRKRDVRSRSELQIVNEDATREMRPQSTAKIVVPTVLSR